MTECRQGRLAPGRERLVARLADVEREGGQCERHEQACREHAREHGPAQDPVDDGRPEARVGGLRAQVREIRDPAAVDPRPEQLEHGRQHRHRADDRARDDSDRAGGEPVEDVGADHEHARHGDRDGRARDEDRAARRARGALERLVRRQAAMPLFARADHVEERVVDPDGHADQQHHRLDAVVDREDLADRAEQPERRGDRGEREQDRHERGDDRAEREQQDDQRDRDREQLGAMQVALDGAVPRLARGDVTGLLDRHLRVRPADREDSRLERLDGQRPLHGPGDEDGVPVGRGADLDVAAERRAHPRGDLCRRRPEGSVAGLQGVAVQVAVLARRWPGPVRVDQRIASRRLADCTVLEGIGPGDDPEGDRDRDEAEPGRERPPGTACAPPADRRHRPHSPSVGPLWSWIGCGARGATGAGARRSRAAAT